VQVHGLIALRVCAVFHKTRAVTFDLYTTSCLLLDVLHVGSTVSDNLGAQVEARNWFHIDRDAFFRPFTLRQVLAHNPNEQG
jgi:hypothetical protein